MKSEIEMLMQRRYSPEYPPVPEEKPVCTDEPQCENCPYPNHGFVCWSSSENCIRKEVERMNAEKERYAEI